MATSKKTSMNVKLAYVLWSLLPTILFTTVLNAQNGQNDDRHDVYQLSWKKELPLLAAGLGMNIWSYATQAGWEEPTAADFAALNQNDVWSFDRSAINNISPDAKKISDVILYSSVAYPVMTYFTDNCRCEGPDVGIMALETLIVINGITEVVKTLGKRYRPYTYLDSMPVEEKLGKNSRKSFFSGHTSVTAALSVFTAKVFIDLHPHWKQKYLILIPALTLPAAIGYFRYRAGKHFPSDVITGYFVGAAVGYLIPAIHKNDRLSVIPTNNSLLLLYRF